MNLKIQEKLKPFYQKFEVRKTISSQKLQNGERQMNQLPAKNTINLTQETTKNLLLQK